MKKWRSLFTALSAPLGEVTPPGDWWLGGGLIDSGDVVAAYRAIGAASQAASKVNLANPGTFDLSDGASTPTWNATDGWVWAGSGAAHYNSGWTVVDPCSVMFRYSGITASSYTFLTGVFSATPTRRLELYPYDGGALAVFGYGDGVVSAADLGASGTTGLSRNQPYNDGVAHGSAISHTWNGSPAVATLMAEWELVFRHGGEKFTTKTQRHQDCNG